jgi:hypothetical protein
MQTLKEHLPWLVPLLISVLIGGIHIYGLIDRVNKLELTSRTRGNAAINQLQNVDNRVKRLEEFCCGELKGFQIYIEDKAHGMDVNSNNN